LRRELRDPVAVCGIVARPPEPAVNRAGFGKGRAKLGGDLLGVFDATSRAGRSATA
jgi:hypothetical protein